MIQNRVGRRKWLATTLQATGATMLCAEAGAAAEKPPVTTAGLAQSVLGLMKKAEIAGMRYEVEALRACAEALLKGGR